MADKNGGRKQDNTDKPPEKLQNKSPEKEKEEEKNEQEPEKRNSVLERHGYKLGRAIGNGSYGTVKLADSITHNDLVAVKIISKFHAPADYLKKFLPREILVVKGLSHPNIIKFHQAIETTHRVYIVMEFANNGTLLDIIKKEGYIDEPRAKIWYRQLIDAIEYCHNCGVVHRDIKCENLLMDSRHLLKLSDFGFARGKMGLKESEYVMSDTFCGSYAYASPEILKGIPYRPQYSDIWSSGVVLYATVHGKLPFDDSNLNHLLKQVQKPIHFPRDPKITPDCKSLIRKILAPLRERLKIISIREQPWMIEEPPESESEMDILQEKETPDKEKLEKENLAKQNEPEVNPVPDVAQKAAPEAQKPAPEVQKPAPNVQKPAPNVQKPVHETDTKAINTNTNSKPPTPTKSVPKT